MSVESVDDQPDYRITRLCSDLIHNHNGEPDEKLNIYKQLSKKRPDICIQQIKSSTPSNVKEKTIGSHLYSCFVDDVCSPYCLKGTPNPEKICSNKSFGKIEGKLKKYNNLATSEAYVFVASDQILTNQDLKTIKESGCVSLKIFHQQDHYISYQYRETINLLNDLANLENANVYNWIGLILLILVILIIVAMFIFFR